MAKIRKEGAKETPAISTASLPDIIFILLFFFMVVTTPINDNLMVKNILPEATELTKIQRKSLVAHLYMGQPKPPYDQKLGTAPRLQLNDKFESIDNIAGFVQNERSTRPEKDRLAMIWALNIDVDTKMGLVSDVKIALRKVDALKISYTARSKEGANTFSDSE